MDSFRDMMSHWQGCLIALLILTGAVISAAPADSMWALTYGGLYNETGCAAVRLGNGDLVMVGSTYSYGSGSHDIYLVRVDSTGTMIWQKYFGGAAADYGYDIELAYDSNFIIVGSTASYGAGGRDIFLLKVSSDGTELWSKTYGGSGNDDANSVRRTYDGGLIICGTTASYGTNGDIYIIRADSAGDSLWTKTYGGSAGETGCAVRETSDSGFAIIGHTGSYGTGYSSIYLIRTDSIGDTLWTSTYGNDRADLGFTLEQTNDNGFILGGCTAPDGANFYDAYIVKTDSFGVVQWDSTYGGNYEDRAYAIAPTSDGGYIWCGTREGSGATTIDLYLVKIDAGGNTEWDSTYGGSGADYGRDVIIDANDDYFCIGYTYSSGSGGSDMYLLKSAASGGTAVDDDALLPGMAFELYQNYPNPFNLETKIEFYLSRNGDVVLTIFNILGQTVRTWEMPNQYAGQISITWDGRDEYGSVVASGIYLYQLRVEDFAETKKMVLVK